MEQQHAPSSKPPLSETMMKQVKIRPLLDYLEIIESQSPHPPENKPRDILRTIQLASGGMAATAIIERNYIHGSSQGPFRVDHIVLGYDATHQTWNILDRICATNNNAHSS